MAAGIEFDFLLISVCALIGYGSILAGWKAERSLESITFAYMIAWVAIISFLRILSGVIG